MTPCHIYSSTFVLIPLFIFFFFNDTATTEIYTLSLHDALPILPAASLGPPVKCGSSARSWVTTLRWIDRKSTRLNSSHVEISYAVFCLKKKKKEKKKRYMLDSVKHMIRIQSTRHRDTENT